MKQTFDVIIVANGTSARMGFDKLSASLGETTVLQKTIQAFFDIPSLQNIIVVCDKDIDLQNVIKVNGGATRSASVQCGLKKATAPYVLIHDGARPFVSKNLIEKLFDEVREHRSAIPFTKPTDSMCRVDDPCFTTVNRNDFALLQTPQAFLTEEIKRAYELANGASETDDSALYAKFIAPIHLVEGEISNKKITYPEDILTSSSRVGTGFDVHKLVPNRPLRLGGVTLPFELGEEAHSDGDVVLHALADALLTVNGLPDIGHLFPDTDPKYKDIDSTLLLQEVASKTTKQILFINIVVLLEKPKISPYIRAMREKISSILSLSPDNINISATTTESLGIIGKSQGVASLVSVTVL